MLAKRLGVGWFGWEMGVGIYGVVERGDLIGQ